MKKRIVILGIGLLFVGVAQAQIFVLEDEQNYRSGTVTDLGVIPENGLTLDQTNEPYTPLGEGVLLLTALGGAYLLGKRNNGRKE